jgi:hypothetical protein
VSSSKTQRHERALICSSAATAAMAGQGDLRRLESFGMEKVLAAPQNLCKNSCAERLTTGPRRPATSPPGTTREQSAPRASSVTWCRTTSELRIFHSASPSRVKLQNQEGKVHQLPTIKPRSASFGKSLRAESTSRLVLAFTVPKTRSGQPPAHQRQLPTARVGRAGGVRHEINISRSGSVR